MAKFSKAIKMYDKMLGFRLARGFSQARKVGVSDVVVLDDAIYSKRYVNRYYLIYGYPDTIERGFLSLFRGCCKGSTQVDVTYLCEPKPIDWGSAEMKSRMRSWSDFAAETSDDVNVFNFSEEYQAAEQGIGHQRIEHIDTYGSQRDNRLYRQSEPSKVNRIVPLQSHHKQSYRERIEHKLRYYYRMNAT